MFSKLAPKYPWDAPSIWFIIATRPISVLARALYRLFALMLPAPKTEDQPIRVVCISDTHSHQQPLEIPDGDLLVHSGDVSDDGSLPWLQTQIDWLSTLPHTHKIVVGGNHDTYFDPTSRNLLKPHKREGQLDWRGIHYLQHSDVNLKFQSCGNRELKIYGAPQTARLGINTPIFAFQYDDDRDAWKDTIPDDIDVLVTHQPPRWHLDLATGKGCPFLLQEVWRVQPRLHVFGHLHEGHGIEVIHWDRSQAALERLLSRHPDNALRGLLSVRNWLDMFWIAYYGCKNVLWMRIWGGDMQPTTCVNGAWMNAKVPAGNPAKVVEI